MGPTVERTSSADSLRKLKPPIDSKDPATRVGPVEETVHSGDLTIVGGIPQPKASVPIVDYGEQYNNVPHKKRTIGITPSTLARSVRIGLMYGQVSLAQPF